MKQLTWIALALVLGATTPVHALEDLGPAHDFRLRTADGKMFVLSEALEKGPVLLDFWATWCAPCKIAMPRWAELVERYAEHGVQLVAVSQDDPRSQPKILPYMRSQGFDFPALLDGEKQVGRKYRVSNVPTTFLIGSDGTIVTHHVGYREGDEHAVEAVLRELLELDSANGAKP
jgi:thiol-disulfide isomerase/thioredoxin